METIVSLGILGVVMIPMLFMSGAYFMGQLAKSRTNIDLAHSVSQFTNRMMEELAYTQQILPNSSADALYLAYYDPLRQKEIRHGYRLVSNSGTKILQKLVYNRSTENWDIMSPFATEASTSIRLPSTADFEYCADMTSPTCTAASRPGEAVMVRLNGWTFSRGTEAFTLPDLDLYVSTAATSGGVMLSDMPRQLFSIPSSTVGTYNLALSFLSPKADYLEALYEYNGTLSTILPTDETNPGYLHTQVVASDGRVYFGEVGTSGRFWTWKDNGTAAGVLSTILPANESSPGASSAVVASDGRIFFGEDSSSGSFWTWHPSTGLTTIVNGLDNPGGDKDQDFTDDWWHDVYRNSGVGPDGRVFFGETAWGHFYTWHPSTGLTTITPTAGDEYGAASLSVAPDSRVFFGQESGPSGFWTWKATTGLTTIIAPGANIADVGYFCSGVASDGRIYFCGYDQTAFTYRFWTWKDDGTASGVLTTIIPSGDEVGTTAVAVAPDGRVFIGEDGTDGRLWTWKSTTGLTTIITAGMDHDDTGQSNLTVSPVDGRVYFGDQEEGAFWTWKDNGTAGGLFSTIFSGGVYATTNVAVSPLDGRVYFGESSSAGNFYTWKDNGTGAGILSTIATNRSYPGLYSTKVAPDGRVFFSEYDNNGMTWTWKDDGAGGKLMPILPLTENYPGRFSTAVADDGRVFFGEYGTGRFWTWKNVGGSFTRTLRLTQEGLPLNQTFAFVTSSSTNYVASVQDMNKDVYVVDGLNKTVDRYSLNTTTSQYTKTGGFNWSANASTVKAVAIDHSNDKIALLDRGNRQIDVYASKLASGSPAVAQTISISGQTTNPTGLAISSRTGNFLVLDSASYYSGGDYYCDLEVYNESGTYLKSIPIMMNRSSGGSNLSVNARSDGNLKIQFDEQKNILFVIAANSGSGYIMALSLPEYL